jgi:iron complex transport system ATP-binding protein
MLQLKQLSVRLAGQPILQNLHLHSGPQGSITCLLGPNGCGKSTLLRTLAGQLAYSGSITRGDQSHWQHSHGSLPPAVAWLPQDCGSHSRLSALKVVLLGKVQSLGWRIPQQLQLQARQQLAQLGLSALESRPVCQLSGGQRQMVFLAQALMREPEILLLDEPISALDLQHQQQVLSLIEQQTRQRNMLTIMVLHDLNAALRYSQHAWLLQGGHMLAAGPTHQVMTTALLSQLFATPISSAKASDGFPLLYHGRQAITA